jgi:hypothetical protein
MGNFAASYFGSTQQIRQAAINASTSGDNTIVAAVPGKQILVLLYKIVCSDAVTVTWESGGGTVLDGPCTFAASGGESSSFCEHGHFRSSKGESLVLNLSGAVQVGGHLLYGLI